MWCDRVTTVETVMSAFTLTANKGSGGGTEKAPAGNHLAVLVGLFDMGHQLDDFDPAKPRWQHRAYFVWELVGEQIAGTTKNHVIGIDLTLSLNEKAKLAKWIGARTGKPLPDGSAYDITQELGQPCMLNVVEKGGYPKVDGVAGIPKGIPVPKPTYTPTVVTLEQFRAGTGIPEWCPYLFGNPLADHIRACREIGEAKPTVKKGAAAAPADGTPAGKDPIPF